MRKRHSFKSEVFSNKSFVRSSFPNTTLGHLGKTSGRDVHCLTEVSETSCYQFLGMW